MPSLFMRYKYSPEWIIKVVHICAQVDTSTSCKYSGTLCKNCIQAQDALVKLIAIHTHTQVDMSTTRKYGATGLGLNLVQKLSTITVC